MDINITVSKELSVDISNDELYNSSFEITDIISKVPKVKTIDCYVDLLNNKLIISIGASMWTRIRYWIFHDIYDALESNDITINVELKYSDWSL